MNRRTFLGLGTALLAGTGAPPGATAAMRAKTAAPARRILMVLTSTGQVPGTDRPTGLWWSEFSEPFALFRAAGHQVAVASTAGGPVPVDPRSGGESRAKRDVEAWAASRATVRIETFTLDSFDGFFLPGGHGTMWDFPDNPALARLVGAAVAKGVPLASVCHGPAGLLGARLPDGAPVVTGRRVNGFTNAEEAAAGMDKIVPFLLETRLRELGGRFEGAGVFASFAVRDGALITGQNPASSERTAKLLLDAIAGRPASTARVG